MNVDNEDHMAIKLNPAIQKIKQQNSEKAHSSPSSSIADKTKALKVVPSQAASETPLNTLKKSKSFQLCSTPKIYNTQVTKELEILNILFINGKLSDNSSQMPSTTQVAASINSQENNSIIKTIRSECKMSPIITSTIKLTQTKAFQDLLRNQELDSPKLDYSLSQTKEPQINLLEQSETLNRNLNFDESTLIEPRPRVANKSESADEDEQLLAHMTKLESSNRLLFNKTSVQDPISKNSSTRVDFKAHIKAPDGKNSDASFKLAQEQENEPPDFLLNNCGGFQTAKGKKIDVSANALKMAKEKLWDKMDETEQSGNFISNLEQDKILNCDFQTAKGKKLSVKADALKLAQEKILDKTDEVETMNLNLGT
jgi:hypothetical protein